MVESGFPGEASLVRHQGRNTSRRDDHAPNNVAKRSLIPDTVVSRKELRPKYGQGWQPGLGLHPRQGDIRDLGKEDTP